MTKQLTKQTIGVAGTGFIVPHPSKACIATPPHAEAAGSKMQNRMREDVILKFQG